MGVIIKEVLSNADLDNFISFQHNLYKHDPCWVPMLRLDELNTFNRKKNPAFEHCEAKLWLAYKNNIIVGRIAGIINRSFIEKWKKNYARFGWIDFIDDPEVSKKLMDTVEQWAVDYQMTAIHGPLGFTDFDPEGMLVEGFDVTGTMQTIFNFPYYPIHIENNGYRKDTDWLEYEIKIPSRMPERIIRLSEQVEQKLNLHTLKSKNNRGILPYAKDIFNVLNEAYSDLYGVVKLNEKQVNVYTNQYFSFIRPEYVPVVLDKNNRVVAFAIAMPSLSLALQKSKGRILPFGFIHLLRAFRKNNTADLYLIAVRPDMQGKGLNAILLRELGHTFIKNNITKAITHPALEDNNKVLALWKNYETKLIRRRRSYLKNFL